MPLKEQCFPRSLAAFKGKIRENEKEEGKGR